MSLPNFEGYAPAHLSHSTVSGYRDCGLRFKLQKIIRAEQRPGLAGLGGNAVHTTTEWYDKGDLEPNADLKAYFAKAWDEEVAKRLEQSPSYQLEDFVATGRASAEYGGKRNVQWWLDNGPAMVQRWIDWRQKNEWAMWETPEGTPAIELELRVILPGELPVKMFLDRIMVTPAGQLVVVDIKTGRQPETPEQLGLYALGIEQTYGEMFRPDWGYFWDAQKGTHTQPQALGRYTADYFAEDYHMAVAGINAGVFLAKPQNNCRNWCGVAKFCKAVGGSLNA